jgi:hypothetical protein
LIVPIVVSDTSPVRALQHLALLPILEHLYVNVLLPQGVADELGRAQERFPALDLSAFPFFAIEAAHDRARVIELQKQKLHAPEAEAIQLAIEKAAALILIDERAGRRVATKLGLHPVGVLGVLIQAKRKAFIPSIQPCIIRLEKEIDFHLSAELIAEVLRIAGE